MGGLKNDVKRITYLYQNKGYSMLMIAEELGVSFSKVRYWLNKNGTTKRNRSEAGYLAHSNRFNKCSSSIKKKLSKKEKELLIAGIMLYWAEGWKKNSTYVSFSNSDARMIRLFLKFLREICGIDESRLRVVLHYYKDQDEVKLKRYWSKVANIPINQFSKGFVHKGKTGTYTRKSDYGTINVRYSDKRLLNQIIEQINDFEKNNAHVAQW